MSSTAVHANTTFFGRLAPPAQASLSALGRTRTYSANSIVFFEGDDSDRVFIIRSGLVKIHLTIDDHDVLLDLLGPGDVLGELSAFDARPRGATAIGMTEAELLVMPATSFVEFVSQDAAVMLELVRSIADRLRSTSRRQVEYGALDATGRVCRRLAEMMDRFGELHGTTVIIRSPLTQNDIAAWAGLSREAVVKALRTLRRLGWVRTTLRSITIIDVASVLARADLAAERTDCRA